MSEYKFYDLGCICGRFGHEHLGHVSLFEAARSLCKRTLILVGSAQEYGTLRNPFRVETRIDVIRETYPGENEDTFMVRGIKDLTNEFNISYDWGRYVKSEIESHRHKFANLMVYGNDEFRSKWFAPEDLVGTAELIIPRSTLPISGTMIRGMLVIDDETSWQKNTPALIHGMYDRLRSELMSVPIYKKIYDEIRKGDMSLDSFMKVYSKYEEEDKQKKLDELKSL